MFEWKVEDMALMNESKTYFNNRKIYNCEHKVSRENKIAFVDSMQDGKLSYILELAKKFEEDKESLPKNKWGGIKTVSLKAWLRRNDTRNIIDRTYRYGIICFLYNKRYISNIESKNDHDTYKDYVDEIFHRQLMACEEKEKRYFLEHDEYSILKRKFRDKERAYGITFGVHIGDWSSGKLAVIDDNDNERDITIDELKELLAKYEELDRLVEKLTADTHIVY